MSLLKRILHYNPAILVKIAFFKMLRQAMLSFEKHKRIKKYSNTPSLVYLNAVQETFIDNFWSKVPLRVIDSKDAKVLLQGNVAILGLIHPLENYLQDPVSNKFWPKNEFFAEARTKINGYGDVKYILELNKLNHLVESAKAYYFTEDIQYIYYIDKQISIWKQEVPYEMSVANRIIMDVAFRTINLIFISLLCMNNGYFKNKIYPSIHDILVLSERQMRRFSTSRWFKTGNGANHVIGEMVGLIVVQRWLAFIENKSFWIKPINQEYKWLEEVLERLVAPSGVYLENSANYTRVVCEFLVCLQIFENAFTKQDTKIEKRYLRLMLSYLNDLQCDGNLPNFGDNDAATVLLPFKKDFADISPLIDFYNENYSKNSSSTKSWCEYLSDGQLIWKSNDENDLYLFMRFGKWSIFRPRSATHLHADLLSVIMFVNGEPVFVDKGCLYYNQSVEVRRKALTAASHNTVFVEGHDQASFDSAWYNYPQTINMGFSEPLCFRAKIVTIENFTHTRLISYKFGDLIIEDCIESPFEEESVKMQYLLHESVVPRVINNLSIELKLPIGKIIIIEFEGIDNLQICKDTYYPHYGIEQSTYVICCVVPNKRAITHIKTKAI